MPLWRKLRAEPSLNWKQKLLLPEAEIQKSFLRGNKWAGKPSEKGWATEGMEELDFIIEGCRIHIGIELSQDMPTHRSWPAQPHASCKPTRSRHGATSAWCSPSPWLYFPWAKPQNSRMPWARQFSELNLSLTTFKYRHREMLYSPIQSGVASSNSLATCVHRGVRDLK